MVPTPRSTAHVHATCICDNLSLDKQSHMGKGRMHAVCRKSGLWQSQPVPSAMFSWLHRCRTRPRLLWHCSEHQTRATLDHCWGSTTPNRLPKLFLVWRHSTLETLLQGRLCICLVRGKPQTGWRTLGWHLGVSYRGLLAVQRAQACSSAGIWILAEGVTASITSCFAQLSRLQGHHNIRAEAAVKSHTKRGG